jgi:NADH-quinone oxidoreductase subunit N
MEKKLLVGVSSLVSLQFFSAFGEYFFSVSSLYALLVVILITYNIYGLILQRALSESLALTSLMTGYLIFNDDLLLLNFLNFNHSIVNDYFAFFTRILICIFSAFYFWMVASCLKEQKIISFEYPLVIFFATLGLLLMCNGNDFLITYLAIELSTLSFYILASFQKMSNSSIDTAVKYFVIGAVSSAFFLLGSSFLYGFTGSIDFSQFSGLLGEKYD